MKKNISLFAIFAALLFVNSCTKNDVINNTPIDTKDTSAQVALDWYKLQLRFLLERNSSLNAVYFGYIGIGLYESVRNETKNSISLSTKLNQMPAMPDKEDNKSYHWQVSANAAMAGKVRSFFTGLTPANIVSIDSLENIYNDKLKPASDTATFSRSQAFGKNIATAIYNWYLTDNINISNTGYIPPVFPGSWEPIPPAYAKLINCYFATGRTFIASNLSKVAPAFPFPYSEDVSSDFYKMVKNNYDVSLALTAEQKNIALFWVDQGNGIGYTPNGHQLSLVVQALEQTKSNMAVAAEAFAKATIAQRDALIVTFKSKYTYNLLRPATYLRKLIDPNWLPFIPSPPHPEYPAAHAVVTGAAMQALARVLGDNVTITDHTYDFRGYPTRRYTTLFKAGEEAGISRLYGGIHYQESIVIGLSIAKEIGNTVGDIKVYQ